MPLEKLICLDLLMQNGAINKPSLVMFVLKDNVIRIPPSFL